MIRVIPDFPKYTASRSGHIFSHTSKSNGRELKQCTTAKGYKCVAVYLEGVRAVRFVHRLILETFIGYCPTGLQCRHLNGDKEDNTLGNLCWGTPQQNITDKIKHGKKYNQGETHPRTKLTEQTVRLIFSRYHDGATTLQELGTYFSIGKSAVSKIVNKKTWRHLWL